MVVSWVRDDFMAASSILLAWAPIQPKPQSLTEKFDPG